MMVEKERNTECVRGLLDVGRHRTLRGARWDGAGNKQDRIEDSLD
jgi:hypothetical protein